MELNQSDLPDDVAVDFTTAPQQDITRQIEDLANKYADALAAKNVEQAEKIHE